MLIRGLECGSSYKAHQIIINRFIMVLRLGQNIRTMSWRSYDESAILEDVSPCRIETIAKDSRVYLHGEVGHFAYSHLSHWIEWSRIYAHIYKYYPEAYPDSHSFSRCRIQYRS